MNPKKIYVKVIAEHDPDTGTKPLSLTWIDGRIYEVDRVLDRRKAASLKAGGWGIRYTCRILGQERYLWEEEGKWFVEGK
ncbi:MAG: hypothetical protein K0R55_3980 [Sporomusa sp.]|nr:hypothetical protein [Sporomusa sp.]